MNSYAIKQLETAPAEDFQPEEGMRIAVVRYKGTTVDGVKVPAKPSAWYLVPDLQDSAEISFAIVEDGTEQKKAEDCAAMFWAGVYEKQDAALKRYHEGELEAVNLVCNLFDLAADFVTDRRKAGGLEQGELIDWIETSLTAAMMERVKETLKDRTEKQRTELVVTIRDKFLIAATRGNKRGNRSLPRESLVDLRQKMDSFILRKDVEESIYTKAIYARIAGHIETIEKQAIETTVEDI